MPSLMKMIILGPPEWPPLAVLNISSLTVCRASAIFVLPVGSNGWQWVAVGRNLRLEVMLLCV